MRITRYPQSCLVVEVAGSRLLIDPGTLVSARYALEDLGYVDAVLYTHRHADHLDPDLVDGLLARDVTLYGNGDVVELLGPGRVVEVHDGKPVDVAGVHVVPHDLPHVPMVDGSPGPPNTGFVIDGTLFHPGDGLRAGAVSVPVLAAPISGPSISFRDAHALVEAVGAETVVPIHYEVFTADPEHFARICDLARVVVLDNGETTDV